MTILIDNKSGAPIYQQIYEQIKAQILSGSLAEHEALPSIRGLAKDLRISFITTKRAYEELERDGFLENVPGKGCFVAAQDPALLRESQMHQVEELLAQAVREARTGGFSLQELHETLDILYHEDEL